MDFIAGPRDQQKCQLVFAHQTPRRRVDYLEQRRRMFSKNDRFYALSIKTHHNGRATPQEHAIIFCYIKKQKKQL